MAALTRMRNSMARIQLPSGLIWLSLIGCLLYAGCSISEPDTGSPAPLGVQRIEYQAKQMAKIEISGAPGTLDNLTLECGYSGDVLSSEPGADIYWSNVPDHVVSDNVGTIVGALLADGFRLVPDGDSGMGTAGIYRGSIRATLILDMSEDLTIRATIVWIDPELIGRFEQASLEWAEPERLLLSFSMSPTGCTS